MTADFSFLAIALAIMASWEWVAPRRQPDAQLRLRWLSNIVIWVAGLVAVYGAGALLGISVATFGTQHTIGLFNIVRVPFALACVISVLALDFGKYLEHRVMHRVPLLWRIHRMHHTDVDFDITVGFRFHPIEALISAAWSVSLIILLGAPATAVVVWHAALLVNAAFAHGNVRMPGALDGVIRLITVTPDMHRVHHSIDERESGQNLGSLLPWWDRLLGTYVAAPAAGLDTMQTGVEGFRDPKHLQLHWMLAHPFLRQ